MALLADAGTRLAARFETREWQYQRVGFSWVLHYRPTWHLHYITLVDADGYDGYATSTPSGYSQNGYEDHFSWGEETTGQHIDKYRKVGSWTEES